jgi:hypothetical protein
MTPKKSKKAQAALEIVERRARGLLHSSKPTNIEKLVHGDNASGGDLEHLRKLVKEHQGIERKRLALESMVCDRALIKNGPPKGEHIFATREEAHSGGLYMKGKVAYRTPALPQTAIEAIKDTARILAADTEQLVIKAGGIRDTLRAQPIYQRFLKRTFGLGGGTFLIASYLVGFIDIRHGGKDGRQTKCGALRGWVDGNGITHEGARPAEATKLSHIIRYCGYAPGKDSSGEWTGRLERRTEGVKLGYNADLRMRLYQWASVIVKAGERFGENKYYRLYVDTRHRLGSVRNVDKPGWCETVWKSSKGGGAYMAHPHSKAWHKMVHLLLEDLYIVWRAIEGLPVWPSYYSAKLGYTHGGMPTNRMGDGTDWRMIGPKMLTVEEALRLVGIDETRAPSVDSDPVYDAKAQAVVEAATCEECCGEGFMRDLRGNQWPCRACQG